MLFLMFVFFTRCMALADFLVFFFCIAKDLYTLSFLANVYCGRRVNEGS